MREERPFLKELWYYVRSRRNWWLIPILVMLLIAGALMIFGQATAVSPFIYALF